jgi:hypothetical protein
MKNLATLWLVVLIVGCIALGARSGMLDLSCGAAMNLLCYSRPPDTLTIFKSYLRPKRR